MIKTRASFLLVLVAVFGCGGEKGGKAVVGVNVAEAEKLIWAYMTEQHIPGLSIAVVTDHQLRWTSAYGVSDVENDVGTKVETVYRLASVSKPLTAVAAMKLAEEGVLDLDMAVKKYASMWPDKPWPITSRQLLSHMGGVRHYNDDETYEYTRHYDKLADALDIFKADPLIAEPGTKYEYSSYGFNLLGVAMEGATGKSFIEVMKEKVFEPAGMAKTREDNVFAIIPNRAMGYTLDNDDELLNSELVDTSYKMPGGGLVSTVEDLAKLAIALQTEKLLSRATLDVMWTVAKTRDGRPNEDGYGLGWMITDRNGRREVWHNGGQSRVNTVLYMLPDQKAAIAILCNQEWGKMAKLARAIGDLIK